MNITDLTVPGVWRCPKCQFTQVNQTLAPDGIGADTRPHLFPCPNDGRDMVPVTWREHAADLEKMLQTALDNQCNEVMRCICDHRETMLCGSHYEWCPRCGCIRRIGANRTPLMDWQWPTRTCVAITQPQHLT